MDETCSCPFDFRSCGNEKAAIAISNITIHFISWTIKAIEIYACYSLLSDKLGNAKTSFGYFSCHCNLLAEGLSCLKEWGSTAKKFRFTFMFHK